VVESHEPVEKSIASALASGEFAAAATLVIEAFGPEILGYLVGRLKTQQDADDVFAMFAEDLWRALPGLSIRTSMRAYSYTLARNASNRYLDRDVRRARRQVPLSAFPEFDELAAKVRTVTPDYLRTETKDAIQRLRLSLSEEEQTLLTLRVDRGLEWLELAEVLADSTDGDLPRGAARLRKRFEAVKKKLAQLARDEGLI
jgi:RNA polymerase sigma-70 factor (ECF subfamily)